MKEVPKHILHSKDKQHAQELEESAIWKHVELYVNEYTLDLGKAGKVALEKMRGLAIEAGLIEVDAEPLRIL